MGIGMHAVPVRTNEQSLWLDWVHVSRAYGSLYQSADLFGHLRSEELEWGLCKFATVAMLIANSCVHHIFSLEREDISCCS